MMQMNEKSERKYYLDNIRHIIVIMVVVYHVIYIFNSVGVVSNVPIKGIPAMDSFLYFVYPWFMCLLFLISGIGARYALEKRTAKEFAKNRVKKLLIPSISGIFILGWITGLVTAQYSDIFMGNAGSVPAIAKYFVYSLIGIGPLWFAHELFAASMVLLLIRAIDKKGRLWGLCEKANIVVLLLLFFAVWGSAQVLNTPVIIMYRNGIYIFLFLLGYFVFSHNSVQNELEKWRIPLMVIAIICGIAYTIYCFGDNYSSNEVLQTAFTNLYAWLMMLAILGWGKAYLNKNTKFTKYMAPRSFGIYVLHYLLLTLFAYLITTYFELPMLVNYIILLIVDIIAVSLMYEIVLRIPVISMLLLGKSVNNKADGM